MALNEGQVEGRRALCAAAPGRSREQFSDRRAQRLARFQRCRGARARPRRRRARCRRAAARARIAQRRSGRHDVVDQCDMTSARWLDSASAGHETRSAAQILPRALASSWPAPAWRAFAPAAIRPEGCATDEASGRSNSRPGYSRARASATDAAAPARTASAAPAPSSRSLRPRVRTTRGPPRGCGEFPTASSAGQWMRVQEQGKRGLEWRPLQAFARRPAPDLQRQGAARTTNRVAEEAGRAGRAQIASAVAVAAAEQAMRWQDHALQPRPDTVN